MKYNKKQLKEDLKKGLINDDLLELRKYMIKYKDTGGNQKETMEILEELRLSAKTEEIEDKMLDLMDFVVGFCSPHMKIW